MSDLTMVDFAKLAIVQDLEIKAMQMGNMQVDYETLTLVPLTGWVKQWPEGDRNNRFDYEGGKDE